MTGLMVLLPPDLSRQVVLPAEPSDEALLEMVADAFETRDPVPRRLVELCEGFADLRALTVRQPWAAAIVGRAGGRGGPKDVENRTRQTRRRGLVLIHSGQRYAHRGNRAALSAWMTSGRAPRDWVFGAILGTAVLEDCHRCDGSCSEWAEPGAWHWVLGERRAFRDPVPARGLLGFWRPDADTLAAVLGQIGRVPA